jgi:hypothetical protein
MRPERRLKPGMDGGLRAAFLISPLHHLRTPEILSKRWGPPHSDNVGEVRTQLLDKGLLVARASQEPAVEREWIERTEEA